MYSSTEADTLRPVVRLGTFEHVVSPSRSEEQEVDYEVMARDYVKMALWDYRSGNRTLVKRPLSPESNCFERVHTRI
uniref:Uncharacterized protein n=1 Tax=Hyaloperonospora arabidopsidis (strain Emoy2) TaxID=559515 RepID=M4BKW5_HYAAE